MDTNYTDITLGYYSKESWLRDNLDWNYEYLKLTLGSNFSIQSRDRKNQTRANNDQSYKSGQDYVFITNRFQHAPDTNRRVKLYTYECHWIPLLSIKTVIYSIRVHWWKTKTEILFFQDCQEFKKNQILVGDYSTPKKSVPRWGLQYLPHLGTRNKITSKHNDLCGGTLMIDKVQPCNKTEKNRLRSK